MLLAVECSFIGGILEKVGTLRRNTGQKVFATRRVVNESLAGYYCSLLVHENLRSGGSVFKTYGESIMTEVRKAFLKWMSRLSETATNWNLVEHPVRKVSATFCAMCCVNNSSYLPCDEAPESEKLRRERKKNIAFYQTESPSSAPSCRS